MKTKHLFFAITVSLQLASMGKSFGQNLPITGRVYADLNKNCVFDSTDIPLAGALVKVYSGTFSQIDTTDINGNYTAQVPISGGPYSAIVFDDYGNMPLANTFNLCPANGLNTVSALPATGIDFSLKKGVNIFMCDSLWMHYLGCNPALQPYSIPERVQSIGYPIGDTLVQKTYLGDGDSITFLNVITSAYSINSGLHSGCWYWSYNYKAFGLYNVKMTYTGPDGQVDSAIYNNAAHYKDTCGLIQGHVYADMNSNCVFDSTIDIPVQMRILLLDSMGGSVLYNGNPNPVYCTTEGSTGSYKMLTPSNKQSYNLFLDEPPNEIYRTSCNPLNGEYFVANALSTGIDFGLNQGLYLKDFGPLTFSCGSPQSVTFVTNLANIGYPQSTNFILKYLFGDGQDTSYTLNANSMSAYYWGVFPQGPTPSHTYNAPGNYTAQCILVDSLLGYNDTLSSGTFTITDTCGAISGRVFVDANANCKYDSGEVVLPNKLILIYDNGAIVQGLYTDSTGRYFYNANAGAGNSYVVQLVNNDSSFNVCPASSEYTISSLPSNNDFALSCKGGFDLSGNLTGWGFKPGYTGYMELLVKNKRCQIVNAEIKLVRSPLLNIISSNPPADMTIGDTLIWYNNGMGYANKFLVDIEVQTSTSAILGDSIKCLVILDPVTGDSVPADNLVNYIFPIKNSWDPNMKLLTTDGNAVNAKITPDTKELNYTVYFQNTGTDYANNIFVLDTIDPNINPNSIQILNTSSPMKLSVLPGNVLKFTFDNINLPDSAMSQPGSHGFVSYTAQLKAGLSLGTNIKNTAYIYFDYNPAVVTNTVKNSIESTTGIASIMQTKDVSIYPNPANSQITLVFGNDISKGVLSITDMLGNTVLTQTVSGNNININTSAFATGIYLLTIKDDESISMKKVSIIH